jgi:hypothetical protein
VHRLQQPKSRSSVEEPGTIKCWILQCLGARSEKWPKPTTTLQTMPLRFTNFYPFPAFMQRSETRQKRQATLCTRCKCRAAFNRACARKSVSAGTPTALGTRRSGPASSTTSTATLAHCEGNFRHKARMLTQQAIKLRAPTKANQTSTT